jgi:carbonic anhydrase
LGVTDELLANAERYAASYDKSHLPMPPRQRVVIVTCMDARINPWGIFALEEGDAHVLRNAGGAVTDDVVRSLAVSQRLLGTEEVIVLHHADCGTRRMDHQAFLGQLEAETGIRPGWEPEPASDPAEGVRRAVDRIRSDPFLPRRAAVRGFLFEEKTGRLTEV